MPLITERVKDIVGKAKLGLFQAHAEDLRLTWIILGETPKARLQEVVSGKSERKVMLRLAQNWLF